MWSGMWRKHWRPPRRFLRKSAPNNSNVPNSLQICSKCGLPYRNHVLANPGLASCYRHFRKRCLNASWIRELIGSKWKSSFWEELSNSSASISLPPKFGPSSSAIFHTYTGPQVQEARKFHRVDRYSGNWRLLSLNGRTRLAPLVQW